MKKRSTKEQILFVLKRQGESTMKEIMENFTVSEIAVRRHIRDLMSQAFISERIIKQAIGRPFHMYELTSKGHATFPNKNAQLPEELLNDIEETLGSEAVSDVLRKRKEREEQLYETHISADTFDEKIKQIADLQDEEGYMVEYNKLDDGSYQIKNYNCPIYSIAISFKEVCHNEKDVLEKMFPDSRVISESKITDGKKSCCWTISPPKAE